MTVIWILLVLMLTVLSIAVFVPMPLWAVGLGLLFVVAVGVFVSVTLLDVLRTRGAVLAPGARRWAQWVQGLGYLRWPLRLLVVVALFAALWTGQTTTAGLIGAGWCVFNFARPMVAWQLRRWTQ